MPDDLAFIHLFGPLLNPIADNNLAPGLNRSFAPPGFPAMAQFPDRATIAARTPLLGCVKQSRVNGSINSVQADTVKIVFKGKALGYLLRRPLRF
jgi:hypothetical protein